MARRMYLVDGSNHAFRVHFALPPMHASTGFPTRALYGFATLFAKMLRTLEPDYCAVFFDPSRTFRHDLFPDYKGTRPDMPEDLKRQWPRLPEIVEGFGFRALRIEGYEADDVMGTIARRFAGPDCEVFLVTGDKDLCQLVNEHVKVLDLMKDEEIDSAGVIERFGVGPDRVIDILGLSGDASDNIPGIPGVGQKTAMQLIQEHGSLEGVLAAAPGIKGKRGENLRTFAEQARLSYRLATIDTNVPLELGLDDLQPKGLQEDSLRALFEEFDMGSIAARLLPERQSVDTSVYRTLTVDDLDALVASLRQAGRFALDLDGSASDPRQAAIVGIGFCWGPREAVYVPWSDAAGEKLKAVLEDASVCKTGHNLKYDLMALRRAGIELRGIDGDTLILDYLLLSHSRIRTLDEMSQKYLGHTMAPQTPVEATLFAKPIQPALAEDAHVAWILDQRMRSRLEEHLAKLYREIELPLTPVLADMEWWGIRLDTSALHAIQRDLAERLELAEKRCQEVAGKPFAVNSRHELRDLLFEELGYTPSKKVKDGWSTDSSVLEKLVGLREPDLPQAILDYRALQKLLSTYVEKLPEYVKEDGRIHSSFNQAIAATGRLSSENPNMQNIPVRTFEGRRIRTCFVPQSGCVFLSADYSQVELRILAHYCHSAALVESFRKGEDIHRRTASEVFNVALPDVTSELRDAAKAINFGLIYGMSAFRLAGDLMIPRAQAQQYMDEYFGRMPEVAAWLEGTRESARKTGAVTTLYGRRRLLPDINSTQRNLKMQAEREAVNTVIQGTAADIIKIAMVRVHQALAHEGLASRILLQVHDELLLEVPKDEVEAAISLVRREMEGAADLLVPLKVNTAIGENWNQAHG